MKNKKNIEQNVELTVSNGKRVEITKRRLDIKAEMSKGNTENIQMETKY